MKASKVAQYGLLIALALVLSYLESLVPPLWVQTCSGGTVFVCGIKRMPAWRCSARRGERNTPLICMPVFFTAL